MGRLRYSLILILSFFTIHLSFAEVRYVSHSGSNTPPYLTWETAADLIMSAINISSFGDTIYVANGVYEEQVVMIPGLSLIGAGMDSCVIDAGNISLPSVINQDSCVMEGFRIISSLYNWCVYDSGSTGTTIKFNHFQNSVQYGGGINVNNPDTSRNSNVFAYKNLFTDVTIGVDLFNSDALIRSNLIYPYNNSAAAVITGVWIGAYFFDFYPLIDSNLIVTYVTGITKSYGTRPIISNNTIILKSGQGINLGGPSDSAWVFNNLFYAERGAEGIYPPGVYHLYVYNNYFTGFTSSGYYALNFGPDQTVINNVVTNSTNGVKAFGTQNLVFKNNNVWNNDVNYSGFTPDSTNISVDPMVVNEDTSNGGPDFHLQMFSPLIDRGDPAILDKDGTRSDIGLYGGPFGEMYQYTDLPPRIPVNLTAVVDSNYIHLKWNKNTEADFNHYNLYRDTTENFTADSTTFVISVADTFYLHSIPPGIPGLYFKLTAVDNQGNESEPSDELHVFLTETIKNEQLTINNYKLFQNYPNPFNPSTKIGYRLKERGYVKLYVYDIKGELVETLVNQYQESGYYEVEFTGGRSENGHQRSEVGSLRSEVSSLASGVYIYQIMVKNENGIPVFSDVKKMILLK